MAATETDPRLARTELRRQDFIDFMVRCGVLTFGDFVGKSGRRMPYFVNAGRYRTGAQLAQLGRFYAAELVERFGDGFDVVFGPAYKGIPLAVTTTVALADGHDREVGYAFDRKEAKDHGEGGRIVGHTFQDGDRVVIVEDVTTAGTSIRETVPLLHGIADVEVVGLLVGVDRRERGSRSDVSALEELSEAFGLQAASLATIDEVIDHLADREIDGRRILGDEDLARIAAYRAEYGPSPS